MFVAIELSLGLTLFLRTRFHTLEDSFLILRIHL